MAGSRTLRAVWRACLRLLEAALLPESGQRMSITCSRCSRWPGARVRSFTKVAAFLKRQLSWGMVLEPTLTRKPPSNHTLTALLVSPIGVSELLTRLEPEDPSSYFPSSWG